MITWSDSRGQKTHGARLARFALVHRSMIAQVKPMDKRPNSSGSPPAPPGPPGYGGSLVITLVVTTRAPSKGLKEGARGLGPAEGVVRRVLNEPARGSSSPRSAPPSANPSRRRRPDTFWRCPRLEPRAIHPRRGAASGVGSSPTGRSRAFCWGWSSGRARRGSCSSATSRAGSGVCRDRWSGQARRRRRGARRLSRPARSARSYRAPGCR